jgi:hypothetical protein
MDQFAFYPELFEQRTVALEALAGRGFDWFTHFTSVDLMHDLFGLEVCGIRVESDAVIMLEVLEGVFPDWPHTDLYYYDYERDRGWKVLIFKNPRRRKSFKTA